MKKLSAIQLRNQRRRNRSKRNNIAHPERPRLVVYRSSKHISAQIIDDHSGKTLVSASSIDKNIDISNVKTKVDLSIVIGKTIAERAIKGKIKNVVFDRNGYPYHGRVKAIADSARESGLKF